MPDISRGSGLAKHLLKHKQRSVFITLGNIKDCHGDAQKHMWESDNSDAAPIPFPRTKSLQVGPSIFNDLPDDF